MSHAELWDDSALVESWNDALEEYKRYHSVHARGERLEDVLQSHNQSSGRLGATNGKSGHKAAGGETEKQHSILEGDDIENMAGIPSNMTEPSDKLPPADQAAKMKSSEGSSSHGGLAIPQHLIGSVHDEGLKSLLMSWYYAGYYTGLYEGQQQSKLVKDS